MIEFDDDEIAFMKGAAGEEGVHLGYIAAVMKFTNEGEEVITTVDRMDAQNSSVIGAAEMLKMFIINKCVPKLLIVEDED